MILLGVPAYPAIRADRCEEKIRVACRVVLVWPGAFGRLGVLTDFEVRRLGVNAARPKKSANGKTGQGKSLNSESANARSQKQQKEASRRAAPDAPEASRRR